MSGKTILAKRFDPESTPNTKVGSEYDEAAVAPPLTELERIARSSQRKIATTAGGFFNKKAFGFDVADSMGGNFYSPQLSTDFLEQPQNLRERRAWYRHFYHRNEIVGAAVDLHSTLPLSRIRLAKPKCSNSDLKDYVYEFYKRMVDRIDLMGILIGVSHEHVLFGNVFPYAEEHDPYDANTYMYACGNDAEKAKKMAEEMKQRSENQNSFLYNKFGIIDKDPGHLGWDRVYILPPDQVNVKKVPFSERPYIEFVPDSGTRDAIDNNFNRNAYSTDALLGARVPKGIVDLMQNGSTIPLNTDPDKGSHIAHIARKKSPYDTWGQSILERCINTLLYQDKLRQAQTSIASRHMTPIRIVWGENLSEFDIDNLRAQVDMALQDPDYSIVANFEVHWDEMGSNGRLLELSGENEQIASNLFAGLEVTRELLTGEAVYSGTRITLEVLNTKYMLFREQIKKWVEDCLFKPVARKKGFVEIDKFGNERLIYPEISFTRLAIRDNDTYFEQLMQLYNKGSVPIDEVLDALNIDPEQSRSKLESDLFSVNDAAFNDFVRAIYSAAGQTMVDGTNLKAILAQSVGLTINPEPAPGSDDMGGDSGGGGGLRFASAEKNKDAVKKQLFSSKQTAVSTAPSDAGSTNKVPNEKPSAVKSSGTNLKENVKSNLFGKKKTSENKVEESNETNVKLAGVIEILKSRLSEDPSLLEKFAEMYKV